MYAVGEAVKSCFFLIDPSTGEPAPGKTVTAKLFNQNNVEVTPAPTVTDIGEGFYEAPFTPDAAGEWTIKFSCANPKQYGGLRFPIGKGVEKATETKLDTHMASYTSARAAKLDEIMAARMSELDAANLPADVDIVKADTPFIHDQAVSSPTTGSLAERISRLSGSVQEGTYSHPNVITEEDLVIVTVTARTKIWSIFLDLVNLTKACTLRLYHKIDGTTYRQVDSLDWATADADGVEILSAMVDHDVKVTIQSVEAEGAARNISYTVNKEAMA